INSADHVIAAARVLFRSKPVSKLGELINGIDQFNFTKELLKQIKANDMSDLSEKLQNMLERLLNKQRIHALYIGEENRLEDVKTTFTEAFASLRRDRKST